MGRVTLQDVADHAGVSMKTVSNVVAGYRHVSPRMRQLVQAAIDELGYRPNRSGRSLATGRSSMLALAFPDLRRPYFAELAHVFARVADARGYRLLLAETGGTADGERAVLHDRESGAIDGIVIHPQALSAAELDELSDGTPIVFLGEDPQPIGADQVAIDNVAAAETAVDHLVLSGRRRVAFLGHEVGTLSRTSALRIRGYRNALERAGLAFGAIAQIHNSLNRLMELSKETRTNGGVAAEDSYYRQRLAQLYIEAETMRLNAYRGLTKTMQSGIPGPEGSLGKWQWADLNQGITELALEIEGAYAPLARGADSAVANGLWQYGFLRSRANSIEGGTTDILRNIIAERVLGLPKLR